MDPFRLEDLDIPEEDLPSRIGEGLHVGMRKVLDTPWSILAWNLIHGADLRGSYSDELWMAYLRALVRQLHRDRVTLVPRSFESSAVVAHASPSLADAFRRAGIAGGDVEEELEDDDLTDKQAALIDRQAAMLTATMQIIPPEDARELEGFLCQILAGGCH